MAIRSINQPGGRLELGQTGEPGAALIIIIIPLTIIAIRVLISMITIVITKSLAVD